MGSSQTDCVRCKFLESRLNEQELALQKQIRAYKRISLGHSNQILDMVISNLKEILTESGKTKDKSKGQKRKKKDQVVKKNKKTPRLDPHVDAEDEFIIVDDDVQEAVQLTEEDEGTTETVRSRSGSPEPVSLFIPSNPILRRPPVTVKVESSPLNSDTVKKTKRSESSKRFSASSSSSFRTRATALTVNVEERDRKVLHILSGRWLGLEDLKVCRLVNSKWYNISSRSILRRDLCALHFHYNSDGTGFNHRSKFWNERKLLSSLFECMERAKIFPCSDFAFKGGRVQVSWPKKLFSNYGTNIKTFKICVSDSFLGTKDGYTISKMFKLALDNCPNLESLEVGYYQNIEWTNCANDRLVFPNLKTLICAAPSFSTSNNNNNQWLGKSTAFEMLSAAPKLQNVHNFKVNYIDWFLARKKVATIKSYDLEVSLLDTDLMRKFARAKPQLDSLKISFQSDKTKQTNSNGRALLVIYQLLRSSKESLKKLEMTPTTSLFIPNLLNLKELTLARPVNCTATLFPPTFNLTDSFPNLTTLNLFLCMDRKETWDQYFPSKSMPLRPMLSVKTLGIHGTFSSDWCQRLTSLLPNLDKIVVHAQADEDRLLLDRTVRVICQTFVKLKRLEFLGCGWWIQSGGSNFDTALTGIPKSILHGVNGGHIGKINPCIRDLRGLRLLKIRISNEKWELDRVKQFDLITRLISFHCFYKMPHLRITIAYHHHCPSAQVITSVLKTQFRSSPSVTLVHEEHPRLWLPS